MFAVMKETDYMNKPTFLKNFWEGFQEVLGPGHVIKVLDKCDFAPMYDHFMAEREKKKAEPKEVNSLHRISDFPCVPLRRVSFPSPDKILDCLVLTNVHILRYILIFPQVKAKNKSDRDAAEAKYKIAHVDGTPQDVSLSWGCSRCLRSHGSAFHGSESCYKWQPHQ